MSSAIKTAHAAMSSAVPLLENGDRLTQAEFHWRYEAYPEDVKFELIGGIVFGGIVSVASPLRLSHSHYDGKFGLALELFELATPGVEVLHGVTTILGQKSEPQPDLGLRILPEFGGQSRTKDDYVEGAPELLTEIAYSTRAIDLHLKRKDYQQAGVLEYVVVCVEEKEIQWFDLKSRRPIVPSPEGIYRSRVFPGLWIDGPALIARDSARIKEILQQGLASREHVRFCKQLQRQKS